MPGIEQHADGSIHIAVKAVPGASRDQLSGWLGDRLKVRVAAPPEGGKANNAIRRLVAAALGVRPADVELVAGQTRPEKTLRVTGISRADAAAKLA